MAKWLPTIEYLRECFSYAPETGALIWKERPLYHFKQAYDQRAFNAQHAGKSAARRGGRYGQVNVAYHQFLAHRIIWVMQTGWWPKQIDHANRDGFDNRWSNLREATHQQNKWNRTRPKRDLPRGVRKARKGPRFTAAAKVNDRQMHLGSFDTPEEAHAAWCAAVQRERGEFFRPG